MTGWLIDINPMLFRKHIPHLIVIETGLRI